MGSNPTPGSHIMKRKYSRKLSTERRKNNRKIVTLSALSLTVIVILFLYGIPLVVRYTEFITNIRSSNTPFASNDQTPPSPPRLDLSSDYTNREEIDINGSSEPGSTVELRINNSQIEVLTNKEGRFSTTVTLTEGDNRIRAKARDAAGNESSSSDEINVIFDKTAPEVEITSPSDGSTYYGQTQKQITIQGNTESNARVTLNDRIVIVENDGTFRRQYTLSDGDNVLQIKVEDQAGNSTEIELKVIYSE